MSVAASPAQDAIRFHIEQIDHADLERAEAEETRRGPSPSPKVVREGGELYRENVYTANVTDLEAGNNLAHVGPGAEYVDWGITEESPKESDKPNPLNAKTIVPYWLQWPMFWFPFSANEWTARLTAVQVVAVCILIIVCRSSRWTWYVTCAMFGDFILRWLAGGRASLMGTLAEIPAHFLPRHFVPGAPKQFAQFCGVLFTGAAALTFFEQHDNADSAGGVVIIGILLGCAFLEGFLNFCVGCFFFGLGNQFGIISDSFRLKYSATLHETEKMRWEMEEDRMPRSEASRKVYSVWSKPLAGSDGRPLEFTFKKTSDQEKRGDFHLIRHCSITYFLMPMGILGLANAWKIAGEPAAFNAHPHVWNALAIASAVAFGIVFILYALKAILYPRKVYKEWGHPQFHYSFCLPPLCILLFIPLTAQEYMTLAEVLFWISAPLTLFLSILTFARLTYYAQFPGSFTPLMMMPALANLVAALAFSQIQFIGWLTGISIEVSLLWFATAVFMWVVLSAVTMTRIFSGGLSSLNEGARTGLWIYVAAPAVISVAATTIMGGNSALAMFAFYITIVFFLGMVVLSAWAVFGRERWSMVWWGYLFPLAALSMACTVYFMRSPPHDAMMQGVSTVALIFCSAAGAIFLAHTLLALVKRTIFVPMDKLAPVSMFRLQHRAVEHAILRMRKALEQGLSTDEYIVEFKQLCSGMTLVIEQHSAHEEFIIWPSFRAQWPTLQALAHIQHETIDANQLSNIQTLFDLFMAAQGDQRASVLKQLQVAFAQFADQELAHLKQEEDVLQAVGRKYVPVSESIAVVRRCFFYTPLSKWRRIIHFQLTADFHWVRKIRFLQCLLWALPDKSTMIGKIVYESVDRFTFQRLCVDLPELAPRHAQGTTHQRYY